MAIFGRRFSWRRPCYRFWLQGVDQRAGKRLAPRLQPEPSDREPQAAVLQKCLDRFSDQSVSASGSPSLSSRQYPSPHPLLALSTSHPDPARRPVHRRIELLRSGEAGRTLSTLGLKISAPGSRAFSLGGCPTHGISFGNKGWQILVNGANPWQERTPVNGLDHRDWRTWVLKIPGAAGPARVYCGGRYLMDLNQSITGAQRERAAQDPNGRHGSIQQLVPETPGKGDYVFLESRCPNPVIDIDRFSGCDVQVRDVFGATRGAAHCFGYYQRLVAI